jgi:hypothetical protein
MTEPANEPAGVPSVRVVPGQLILEPALIMGKKSPCAN